MSYCAGCKGNNIKTTMLPAYEATGLGAPFKVILEHAVKVDACEVCGAVQGTYIPDMPGLFHAVVFARALEPRKLTGAEIRFMRKAMGWKAKDLARHLSVTPEYLSRCESGAGTMSATTEKLFRIYAVLRTPDRSALKDVELSELFDLIEIEPIWDASNDLKLYFVRCSVAEAAERASESDEKWRKDKKAA